MCRLRRRHKATPPRRDLGPLEGEKARRKAEDALYEVRERAARQQALRHWFRAQYEVNGYGHDVDTIWEGRQ